MLAQTSEFIAPSIDWWALTPQMILVGAALVIMLVTSLSPVKIPGWVSTLITVAAATAAGVVAWWLGREVHRLYLSPSRLFLGSPSRLSLASAPVG